MQGLLATGDGGAQHGAGLTRHTGFTLVELMVVLAIMVLIAASLPLALNRMLPARRVAVAADALIANIHWLQSRATQTGQVARLSFVQGGYELEAQSEVTPRTVVLTSTTQLKLRARGDDREVDSLTVYPDGTSAAGRFEILDSGRHAIVEISMLTGRARRIG